MNPTRFPLVWPAFIARTPEIDREYPTRFARRNIAVAAQEVYDEAHRLASEGGRVVFSSNVPLRADGFPSGDAQPLHGDPGVAVHLVRHDRWFAITCDRYQVAWANARALALILSSTRRIERYGSQGLLEQALGGFAALPPARELQPPWFVTLGFDRPVALATARAAGRALLLEHHPDKGGDAVRFALITDALRQAAEAAATNGIA